MSFEQYSTKSLVDFVKCVLSINKNKKWGGNEGLLWFRGVSHFDWDLKPRLYRSKEVDEDEVRIDFQRFATQLVERVPGDVWDWYFLMQHYGAPTRLLDWTDSALIGLYFAVRAKKKEDNAKGKEPDAAVWVLEPGLLNKQVIGGDFILLKTSKEARPYLSEQLPSARDRPTSRKWPIAIDPPHMDVRLAVQRSHFTLYGNDPHGIEKLAKKKRSRVKLAKIKVPSASVGQIRDDLTTFGISEMTVFPDLEGLGREVTYHWMGT